jgi:hypothetical protein
MKKKQKVVWTKKKILILIGALLIIIAGLLVNMKIATSKMSTDSQATYPTKTGMIYSSRGECLKHCKRCTSSGCTGERFRCITLPTPKSLPSVYPTL